ncbi:MAG: SGNH/GDSL hydrolase family protein [Chloroflexota bacterium]|nr:SGNH/GDSL hydrolase family protein [Chloroflexota bacterium]
MKTIVCFGDSNTWGYNAATNSRHPHEVRWTGVLAAELGSGYRVIEEGLNGRTTNLDDIIEPHRNGLTYLQPCLMSHAPIDAVTVMLGTNDLKGRFNRSVADIAHAASLVCETARTMRVGPDGGTATVLMIAPPAAVELSDLAGIFVDAVERSKQFAREYEIWARRLNFDFLDAASIIECDPLDGIHIDATNHARLARAVAAKLREMFGSDSPAAHESSH